MIRRRALRTAGRLACLCVDCIGHLHPFNRSPARGACCAREHAAPGPASYALPVPSATQHPDVPGGRSRLAESCLWLHFGNGHRPRRAGRQARYVPSNGPAILTMGVIPLVSIVRTQHDAISVLVPGHWGFSAPPETKKADAVEHPEGAEPRRLTRQRTSRRSWAALHLVIRLGAVLRSVTS